MATVKIEKITEASSAGVDTGATPVSRVLVDAPAAITDLVDSTGGTPAGTLVQAAGANPTAAEFENNCASIAAQLAAINAALKAAGITQAS